MMNEGERLDYARFSLWLLQSSVLPAYDLVVCIKLLLMKCSVLNNFFLQELLAELRRLPPL